MAQPRRTSKAGRGFWREWRGEIIALAVAALGIFLLVEQYDIRGTAGRLLLAGLQFVLAELRALSSVTPRVRTSDLVGLLLLAVAVYLIVRRTVHRLQRSPEWSVRACPRCGRNTLRRVHRRRTDIMTWFLPLRRYACQDQTCGWKGLRAKPLRTAPHQADSRI